MLGIENNQIEFSSQKDLASLQEKVGRAYLSYHALCLLKKTLSENVKQFVFEYPYVDKDFRSTYYSDFSKRHQKIDRNSYRVHLFGEQWEYFGFFTLRNTPPFNMGRAYISPKAFAKHKGHLLLTRFECHILGKNLTVDAFPWMQQDANISRCAQVSIWAIARYYSEKYAFYGEHTIQQIFELASSYTRKIPSKGLTIENISSIFSSIGFYPEIYFSEIVNDKKIFNEIIYVFIESGIPFVAGLRSKRHAITIIGHLKIEHENDNNEGSITPISDLIKGYFSVDDNLLPYSVVGSGGTHSICDIDTIIVPLYEKMYLDVLTLLSRRLPEIESSFLPQKNMYRRVFMASSKSFKKFVFDNVSENDYKFHLLLQQMPKFIWVAEYIVKDDYPHHVHSRFIFDATAMEYAGIDMMISARIGNMFISGGKSIKIESIQDPIYRNNLREAHDEMDGGNAGSQQPGP